MAEYTIQEISKALGYNSVQAVYKQSKELEELGYMKLNNEGKKVITEDGLQYLKIKRLANYRADFKNEEGENLEEKLTLSEAEIENKFLKKQIETLQAELTYFKTKCEKYEKDNDVWKEMYRDKDKQFLELTISKKQENALTIRKKRFWDFIRK